MVQLSLYPLCTANRTQLEYLIALIPHHSEIGDVV